MKLSLIVAISKNHAIGKDNKLLWYIPEDLKRFRALTNGHCVIMGRKTYESIGKPLPNRTNIIVTHDKNFKAQGCLVVHSLIEAVEKARNIFANEFTSRSAEQDVKQNKNANEGLKNTYITDNNKEEEIFIIGGGQIYEQAMPLADKLYVTVIDSHINDADTFFPEYQNFTKVVYEEKRQHQGLKYTWLEIEKEI